jgi:EAL domain-containing protein (putative c-di-GMP-specific phosphodiesterase class I)
MLPFSKIKVDKSFIDAIGKGDGPNKMLQALALLGDALNLDMVAEGVETESQAAMLRLLGFKYLQGWHFGAPMTARALAERMNSAA